MGGEARVWRAKARGGRPVAPTSHPSSGALPPKPSWIPHSTDAVITPSTAGRPSRKKAAKLTTISRSINASVRPTPARPAAATVTPLVEGLVVFAIGSYAMPDELCWAMPADPATSDHECRLAFEVSAAATPAGTIASSAPAASAATLRLITPPANHRRFLRVRPTPVSINRSRSNVTPHSTVRATQATIGSSSDAVANGDLNTNNASGRSATAADTGDRRNDHAPPDAPSRGNSMKPSMRPIAAQYAVTAATNANTGSRSHGAVSPKNVSIAMPAAIHSVTQTVLTTAPGSTSSQMSDGSSTGVYSSTSSDCCAFSHQMPIELLIDSSSANDMKNSGSSRPACRACPPANRCATWPAWPGSLPNSDVPPTSSSTNALRYITQLRSPRRHHELT